MSVAGKVSASAYARLSALLGSRGINIYQMIQNSCDCFIRYMDDRHNLTPDIEKAISVFEHMEGWRDCFNLADPKARPQVAEATYYMTDACGGKGVRAVHVERPFFGDWNSTFNVQQIVERSICLAVPSLYRRLRMISASRDCGSILELLTELATELEHEEDKRSLREPFEDADRSEYGQKPHVQPYRRRPCKTDDTLFREDMI